MKFHSINLSLKADELKQYIIHYIKENLNIKITEEQIILASYNYLRLFEKDKKYFPGYDYISNLREDDIEVSKDSVLLYIDSDELISSNFDRKRTSYISVTEKLDKATFSLAEFFLEKLLKEKYDIECAYLKYYNRPPEQATMPENYNMITVWFKNYKDVEKTLK